jgi:hypothetical protein
LKLLVVTVTAFCFFVVSPLQAQLPPSKQLFPAMRIEKTKNNILMGLRSDNAGVIEAAAMLTAKLKMRYPEIVLTKVIFVLDTLSISSPVESLRYKAHLTSRIFHNPDWFTADTALAAAGIETFFLLAAQRLQHNMFQMNLP